MTRPVLVLLGTLLALGQPFLSAAFELHVFRSGMTVAEALDAAERADLPLVANGVFTANRHFDPVVSRKHQDTATEFSYAADIFDRSARVVLHFEPKSRRLHALTVRWGATSISSDFGAAAVATLESRFGRGIRGRDSRQSGVVWDHAGDRIGLFNGLGSLELWYLDRTLSLPGTGGPKVPRRLLPPRPRLSGELLPGLPISPLLLLFAALATRALWRTPAVKGAWGEWLVRIVLRLRLDPDDYAVLHDVTLPSGDGTTQIDHLVIGPNGIFVIETKNMGGWIYGSERDAKWTQVFWRRKHRFQNPLRQNYKHVRTVCERFGLAPDEVHSVVVFVGSAKFKTDLPGNVLTLGRLSGYLVGFRGRALPEARRVALMSEIGEQRLAPGWGTRRQHVRHVSHLREFRRCETREPAAERVAEPAYGGPPAPLCPRCGADMVFRAVPGAAGQQKTFWRCSGFPRCGGAVAAGVSASAP